MFSFICILEAAFYTKLYTSQSSLRDSFLNILLLFNLYYFINDEVKLFFMSFPIMVIIAPAGAARPKEAVSVTERYQSKINETRVGLPYVPMQSLLYLNVSFSVDSASKGTHVVIFYTDNIFSFPPSLNPVYQTVEAKDKQWNPSVRHLWLWRDSLLWGRSCFECL